MHENIWNQVVSVIRITFDDDSLVVEEHTTAADVPDWDSISNIELMVALEEEFGVTFRTGEIAGLPDVGSLARVIADRVAEPPG